MFSGEGTTSKMYNYAHATRREIQSWIKKHAARSGRNKMYKTPPRTYIFIVLKQIVNVHTYAGNNAAAESSHRCPFYL